MKPAGPGCLVRGVYFIFIGWWLGALATTVAWLLNVTIIGLPLGLAIINHLGTIITLQPRSQTVSVAGNTVTVAGARQHGFVLRAIYFLLIGWWLSGLWMAAAYLALISIVLIPLAFWMYNRTAAITTLHRN